jgi:ribosomal protein L37AE/L43A
MLSEELQKLIEASLTDGVLTDKERAVIHKKALLEGADPDEIDILLDSEVQKINQKKQEDVEDTKKCPNCGKQVKSTILVCPSCGYNFDTESKEILERFNKELSENNFWDEDKSTFIESFPVPNSAQALFDFTLLIKHAIKEKDDDVESADEKDIVNKAYKTKLSECIDKIELLYPNDLKFEELLYNVRPSFSKTISEADNKSDNSETLRYISDYKLLNYEKGLYEDTLAIYKACEKTQSIEVWKACKKKLSECREKIQKLYPDNPKFQALLGEIEFNKWQRIPPVIRTLLIVVVVIMILVAIVLLLAHAKGEL